METFGWIVTVVGVALAVLAPLDALPASNGSVAGLPAMPLYVFASVGVMGLGFVLTYFGGLRDEAERLDREQGRRGGAA